MRLFPAPRVFRRWPALAASAAPAGPADDDDDPPMSLKLVVLDIGGTMIGDHGEVPDAMLGAFSRKGITVTPQEFSEWRGASKRGMVKHFVEQRGPQDGRAALDRGDLCRFHRHGVQGLCRMCSPFPARKRRCRNCRR